MKTVLVGSASLTPHHESLTDVQPCLLGVILDSITMGRNIIISNRLPYRLAEDGKTLQRSAGGLTSALGPLHEKAGSLWIGAADFDAAARKSKRCAAYEEELTEHGCVPVFLTKEQQKRYYDGASNSTIWPLFHGFSSLTRFDEESWHSYQQVNRLFCDAVVALAQPDDIIWVQDYHLMLLPRLLRDALPHATIGFFLHIPFPDYETFRILPWRQEILEGLLGADLVGFHTYDYVRHFLSSCRRILGLDNRFGSLQENGRLVRTDVFPLGIDYQRFNAEAHSPEVDALADTEAVRSRHRNMKAMLSIERLDYTKGIPGRLRAFDMFLERHPEWIGRISFTLVTVPSRETVSSYRKLKHEVEELVGHINGKYATFTWAPIDYYFRSLPFDELCMAYRESDVMLVTPLRDGMNLVCKEYLATHEGREGVLILSEMAGAASELSEALQVNPYDSDALVDAMQQALTMPGDEQIRRNEMMQRRLRRYTSDMWSHEFLETLFRVKREQRALAARTFSPKTQKSLLGAYRAADRRAVLLDYDGTLVPFSPDPRATVPDAKLLELLGQLANDPRNSVVILSGRDRTTLEAWLGKLPIDLVAEHGAWAWDHTQREWTLRAPLDTAWKNRIKPVLQDYVDRTPGSLLEEKDYSLVWHYRACSTELAERRVAEMRADLIEDVDTFGLQLADGNKIVEVKMANVDKGSAAFPWLSDESYGFQLCAGDDFTDEDMFHVAPKTAWTIKVGSGPTLARYTVEDCSAMRQLLEQMSQS